VLVPTPDLKVIFDIGLLESFDHLRLSKASSDLRYFGRFVDKEGMVRFHI
tara:strand:+ start:1214 stop:1363 length:150 start_codon:yes stop_codon:yes gene_type:complete